MKIKLYAFVYIVGLLFVAAACNKKNDYATNVDVVKEWDFPLSSSNENYITPDTGINADFHLVVLADNSIRYDIKVDTSVSDRIVTAQINLGDPVSEGTAIIDLPVRVYGTYGSGVLTGLSQSLIDTLLNNNIEKYINVTSANAPNGLVRGQLNTALLLSKNVVLTGSEVVPSVTTTATGTAFLRLDSNYVLYSKVVVNNDPADAATTASVNQAAAGANGPVVLDLVSSPSEFGVGKKTTVNAAVSSTLLTNNTYVSVSSASNPAGKLRGQIR